jgi:RNA polymerase sigma factor (sigma-70 family)
LSRQRSGKHRGPANRTGGTALRLFKHDRVEHALRPSDLGGAKPFTFHLSPVTFHPRPLSLLTYVPAGMTGWLSSSAGGHLGFETTQWSLVAAANDDEQRRSALEGLYRSYSSPVYAFIRRHDYSRQDAQDLTQDFFIHLVEKNAFSRADPDRGKFRTFLLGSLQIFLQHAAERARTEKRGGQAKIIFLDDDTAEAGYQLTDPGQTAEQIFHARWLAALIEGALSRLQAEMEQSGKKKLFDQICGFLLEDEESSYIEVSQRAGLTISAVKASIYRLRGRYRELLRAEVARTVTSSADFDDEIRAFRASLAGRRK